jgi:hypothetical protein
MKAIEEGVLIKGGHNDPPKIPRPANVRPPSQVSSGPKCTFCKGTGKLNRRGYILQVIACPCCNGTGVKPQQAKKNGKV